MATGLDEKGRLWEKRGVLEESSLCLGRDRKGRKGRRRREPECSRTSTVGLARQAV